MKVSSGSSELGNLRRLGVRGALLVFPLLAALLLELFVLPIDLFTFRIWEAALATPYRYPGSYYPNLHVIKAKEFGDQYRNGGSDSMQSKRVEWFTDAYGMRNRPEIEKREKYDVVVLGDSNIVGSSLDQKNILTEVISARSGGIAYSYSIAHDILSLFLSDPRFTERFPRLLVVESKLINWNTNNSSLINFREMPDGELDLIDRRQEFSNNFYAPGRNLYLERVKSRLMKQAMFHWLQANLRVPFTLPTQASGDAFLGLAPSRGTGRQVGWHLDNGTVENAAFSPVTDEGQPAIRVRATGPNAYWLSERFVAKRWDEKIIVRFEAKNSVTPSRHRIWIFEDGSYRLVGEFVAASDWRRFEIPIGTNPGSILQIQIDQRDEWQSLLIRDFEVVDGGPVPFAQQTAVAISMQGWTQEGVPCSGLEGGVHRCRKWLITDKNGYVQTPVLPKAGEGGLLIRFEARIDRPATTFTPVYLFEGEKYRIVAQIMFDLRWRQFSVFLQPNRNEPTKLQVNYPDAADSLLIRDFLAIPLGRIDIAGHR
jgi:hypothetical protein